MQNAATARQSAERADGQDRPPDGGGEGVEGPPGGRCLGTPRPRPRTNRDGGATSPNLRRRRVSSRQPYGAPPVAGSLPAMSTALVLPRRPAVCVPRRALSGFCFAVDVTDGACQLQIDFQGTCALTTLSAYRGCVAAVNVLRNASPSNGPDRSPGDSSARRAAGDRAAPILLPFHATTDSPSPTCENIQIGTSALVDSTPTSPRRNSVQMYRSRSKIDYFAVPGARGAPRTSPRVTGRRSARRPAARIRTVSKGLREGRAARRARRGYLPLLVSEPPGQASAPTVATTPVAVLSPAPVPAPVADRSDQWPRRPPPRRAAPPTTTTRCVAAEPHDPASRHRDVHGPCVLSSSAGCGQRAVAAGRFDSASSEHQGYLDPGRAGGTRHRPPAIFRPSTGASRATSPAQ